MAKKLKKTELKNLNKAYLKVLYWFFSFPTKETGLNDLSSDLKISKTTAKILIKSLVKEGFLHKKIFGKTWIITCNLSHQYNYSKKISYNLEMIYKAYFESIREQIVNLVGNTKSVVLFGSYRKGDDTDKSDIDLAVEVSDDEDLKVIDLGVIPKFGFRKEVQVNLHIFSRKKVNLNFFSNIANGIVLEGFLEVRR